ncbi:MAG: 2-succinyl-5-enolpyruvyl-6-hydroxy-3-cyclohexene-1-carboxylic-acid synthase [Crocinitomicaceae bacterium]
MKTTDKQHIVELVDVMAANGIHDVVISPGSRNAPLTIAFSTHPNINVHLIHDERVAAFYALGLAEGKGSPTAICCTSGSAALNYAPAIAEAYYRQIPLLILTADRPANLIDQGDGQCIRQNNVYSNFIKSEFTLPEETDNLSFKNESNDVVIQALSDLQSVPTGPIHINVPLHEPLYAVVEKEESKAKIINNAPAESNLTRQKEIELQDIWQSTEKKLIIIGQLSQAYNIKPYLDILAQQNSVAILVENTSNLQSFSYFNHSIDRSLATISESEIQSFAPDLILSLGGAIVSKKIKAFLRNIPPKHNWRLGHYLIDEDTFLSKTETVKVNPAQFLKLIADQDEICFSNYSQQWKGKDLLAMERHQEFIKTVPFSDLLAIDLILDTLPDGSNLQMANSSVVRYCQLFNPIFGVKYFSNRGVSGIDGSTSTAVGMARAKPNELITLISGDISFFYDSNGLWIENLPSNLRIFLINNNGGAIFNILEGSRKSAQNQLFVAPHRAKASSICEAYNVDYAYAEDINGMESLLHDFYLESKNNRPKLMEVNTASCPNHETLMNYFNALK